MLNTITSWFKFEIVALKKRKGYDNVNYLLTTKTDSYIFKTYLFPEAYTSIELFKSVHMKGFYKR
ncbi:hypothetical protein [Psychroserpens burtonensis]|uniref:hypothetical protein n=1 Tax=Psychroserpens burtonensis TaxID=49278 RepID=UPI0003FC50F9|nr:hypothetical protein [Psychroserpens burtonensis]